MADVFVGGVQGFSSLATASASAALRATGRIGLYQHANGVQNAYADNSLGGIVQAFVNNGFGIAELPFMSDPASWFNSYYNQVFTQSGLAPSIASVDLDTITVDLSAWSTFVNAAQAAGISHVAPIYSPNDKSAPLGDFATLTAYASLRSAALLGGAITLDTPPGYALERGNDYLATIASEIHWARANALTVTVILSPTTADYDTNFLQDTALFIARLAAANALPDNWAVETYATDDVNVVGSETDPQSVAGVALWIASNVDTPTSLAAAPSSQGWTTPMHFAVGGSSLLSINDKGGQAYVVGSAGGLTFNSSGAQNQVWTTAGSTNTIVTGASAAVYSRGTDSISVGSGSNVFVEGSATIQGGTGAGYYSVAGTSTLLSQSSTADVIQTLAGATLNLTVTGRYFTLFDTGATIHLAEQSGGDNNVADISGGGATIYGGSGKGLTIDTNAALATKVTLGAGNTLVAARGNDTVIGGSGNSTVLLLGNANAVGGTGAGYYSVAGTSTLLSQSSTADVIQTLAGATLNLTVTGRYFTLFDTGATIHLAEQSGGDNNVADISGGGATIYGGSGKGLTIDTNAALATKVTLGAGNTLVAARGNDTVIGGSGNSTVLLLGNANAVGGTGAGYYSVAGTSTLLSQSSTADVIQTLAGATLNLTVTGRYFTLFDTGATIHLAEQSGGDNNVADISGGGATIYGGSGKGLTIDTNAALATKVTLGAGNTLVAARGNDTVIGGSGNSTVLLLGNANAVGGTGAGYYSVAGTSTLLSQSSTADVIQTLAGATLNLTVTGRYFTLFDTGATIHLAEQSGSDNNVADISGGGATIYGGSGKGLTIDTNAALATKVTLGAGNTLVAARGNDTVIGGSGNSTVLLLGNANAVGGTGAGYYSVAGTSTLLSQSSTADVIQTLAGATLNLTVTGRYFTLFDTGATIHLAEQSGSDNNVADISGGGATIYGGSGKGLTIDTNAALATKVTLGAGNTLVAARGNDTVIGGSGNSTVLLLGNANAVGGTGAGYYSVAGTSTLLSQSSTADVIQTLAGATLNLTVTGRYFTLFDTGATIHLAEQSGGDNNVADISGGGATIYGGSGKGLTIDTNAALATKVTLGAGNTLVAARGNDTVIGGSGNSTVLLLGNANAVGGTGAGYYSVAGTSTLLSQSSTADVIQTLAGATLNLTVTGRYFTLFDTGATIHLAEQSGSDNNVADISGGGATIYGGSGKGLTIDTNAALATKVTLGAGNTLVAARGNDTVIGGSGNSTVLLLGNANAVGGTGAGYYSVAGTSTLLSQSSTADVIQTLAGATLNLTVTGRYFTLFDTGATIHLAEQSGSDNNVADISGGGATIYGGSGKGLTIDTNAALATKVTLGAGNTLVISRGSDMIHGGSGQMTFIGFGGNSTVIGSNAGDTLYAGTGLDTFYLGNGVNAAYLGAGSATVTGGTGTNVYHFAAGSGTRTIEIKNFTSGRDSFDFSGFSGNAITKQTVSNGFLTAQLADGAKVIFDAITKPF